MVLTITIAGTTMTGNSHFVMEDSIQHVNALGQRDTLKFKICSLDGTYKPDEGAEVILSDGVGARFGGNVRQLHTDQIGLSLVSTIGCASWEQLFDRRPTGVPNTTLASNGTYTSQAAGDIIQDLLTNTMGGDGVTASIVVTGPVIPVVTFDFAYVRQAFDTICALASDDTDTYMWDCTPTKVLRFYRSDSFHAPFDITTSSTDVLQRGGSNRIGADWDLNQYANRVFVRLGKHIRDAVTESFVGDGVLRAFTVGYPIAKVPIVEIGSPPVAKSVGILDVDTGKDWYWQDGSPTVTQDVGGTVVAAAVAVDITYEGYEATTVGPVTNTAEVAARAAAEGTLGYYTKVLDMGDTPGTTADALAWAQAWLDKYSQIPCSLEYPTPTDGMKAGQWQDCYLPELGVDLNHSVQTEALVESVTMTQTNGLYQWRVKIISGALTGDYKSRLRELRGTGGGATGVGPQGAPGTPGATGGSATPAPNVDGLTASIVYAMRGNDAVFGIAGSIDLPAVLTDLAQVVVFGIAPGSLEHEVARFSGAAITGSSISYAGGEFSRTVFGGGTWKARCVAYNSLGEPTASPVEVTGLSITSAAVTGFTAAVEFGSRYAQLDNRLLHLTVAFIPIVNVPTNVSYWLSTDNGVTYTWIGWQLMDVVGKTLIFDRLALAATATWKIAAAAGAIGGDGLVAIPASDLPSGSVISSGFAVAGLTLPPASAITTATVGAAVAVSEPDTGHQYVRIPGPTWTDPTDPNASFIRITVQCVNSSGTAAPADQGGTEVVFSGPNDPMGDVVSAGKVRYTDPLLFDYNPAGSAFTYIQFRMYVMNRLATSTADWSDPTKSVLQTTAWSGAAFYRVNFGSLPAGALDLTRANHATVGSGLVFGADGKPKLNTTDTTNVVMNPGFEDAFSGWTLQRGTWTQDGPYVPPSGQTVSGAYRLKIITDGAAVGFYETAPHLTKPGDVWYVEVWSADAGAVSGEFLNIQYLDSDKTTQISFVTVASGGNNGAFHALRATFTVPALVSYLRVWPSAAITSGFVVYDNIILKKQPSTGDGTMPDGFGGIQARLGGAYVDVDGSGNLRVTGASLDSTRLASGSLGDLSKYSSSVRAIGIVFGLPSLPTSSYPQGAIIFNTSDSKLYRNTTGSAWSKGSDPQDLIAGTLAAGVVYAGTVVASQIAAGTIAAAITMTAPSLVISGSGYTINLDTTNGFKVTGNNTTTTITNVTDALSGQPAGIKVLDTSTIWYTTHCPRGFFMSDGSVMVAQLSQAGAGGFFKIQNPSSGSSAQFVVSSGSPLCRLDGSSPAFNINGNSGYTGTLASAAGRNVLGGIII